jgi:23S rRNA (guanosine2251-2'-O)-methyltransferase
MIIYGINPVLEALQSGDSLPDRIWITRGKSNPRLQKIVEAARSQGIPVRFESDRVVAKKAASPHHQEIVAEISSIGYVDEETLLEREPTLLLLVDGVEDPRNLGALLRTAEATGVEGVFLPNRRSCAITGPVVKSSAGAALHLSISRIGNVVQTLEKLKKRGYWVVGLDAQGKDGPNQIDASLPLVVVVGGEHQGVRRVVREHCDFLLSLPMKGKVSSLNLSVAAGVLLYEILLKREGLEANRRPQTADN